MFVFFLFIKDLIREHMSLNRYIMNPNISVSDNHNLNLKMNRLNILLEYICDD